MGAYCGLGLNRRNKGSRSGGAQENSRQSGTQNTDSHNKTSFTSITKREKRAGLPHALNPRL